MKLLYFFLQPAIQWAIWSNCDLPCLETNVQLYSSQSDSQIHTLAHKHTHTHYLSLSLSLSRTHKYTHLLFLFHALTDTHTHTYTHKTSYIVFWKGVEFCSNASYNRWLRMKFLDMLQLDFLSWVNKMLFHKASLWLRCDERFTHAFTACNCVFKENTLVVSNQGNYFENATACRKRTLKTTVATQLKVAIHIALNFG